MRLEKLFKVLVAGALLTPTMMCTRTPTAPTTAAGKPGLAQASAATDADVIASATTAIADAGATAEVGVDESEGVSSWLSW